MNLTVTLLDYMDVDEGQVLDGGHGGVGCECKLCEKQAMHKGDMRKHIEANHLEGVLVSCSRCEKTFRSRNSLAVHTSSAHKKSNK